ncbi:hypothetical protein [Vibrio paucivorans]
MSKGLSAFVIVVETSCGPRYFSRVGLKGQVITAWSIAGAELFLLRDDKRYQDAIKKLDIAKKNYTIFQVECALKPVVTNIDLDNSYLDFNKPVSKRSSTVELGMY